MHDRKSGGRDTNWVLIGVGCIVALLLLFTLAYKVMFRKQMVNCLDRAATAQQATTPLTSVEKYAACLASNIEAGKPNAGRASAPVQSARCAYAGVWNSQRGTVSYEVTLEPNGRFTAEPGSSTPLNTPTVTGAWAVTGNVMVWAYDRGAVWPPDLNPISAQTEKGNDTGFTLTEVNGSTTRYTLIERTKSEMCSKK
ncbi:MAG: hypothetical protein ABI905_17445 [Betaproteobacteria bacterium]